VTDVASAVTAALTAPLPPGLRTLNIGSGRVTTVGQIADLLSQALGGPEPEVTGRFRLGNVRHVTADCRQARQVLGWRPEVDLEVGLTGEL